MDNKVFWIWVWSKWTSSSSSSRTSWSVACDVSVGQQRVKHAMSSIHFFMASPVKSGWIASNQSSPLPPLASAERSQQAVQTHPSKDSTGALSSCKDLPTQNNQGLELPAQGSNWGRHAWHICVKGLLPVNPHNSPSPPFLPPSNPPTTSTPIPTGLTVNIQMEL